MATLRGFREFVIALTSFIKAREVAGLFTATTANLMGGASVGLGDLHLNRLFLGRARTELVSVTRLLATLLKAATPSTTKSGAASQAKYEIDAGVVEKSRARCADLLSRFRLRWLGDFRLRCPGRFRLRCLYRRASGRIGPARRERVGHYGDLLCAGGGPRASGGARWPDSHGPGAVRSDSLSRGAHSGLVPPAGRRSVRKYPDIAARGWRRRGLPMERLVCAAQDDISYTNGFDFDVSLWCGMRSEVVNDLQHVVVNMNGIGAINDHPQHTAQDDLPVSKAGIAEPASHAASSPRKP